MKRVSLILALHNHQPVGNFDWVFEQSTRQSYLPVLEAWEQFHGVPLSLHNSGVLWAWLEAHHPEYLEHVARMVDRGQLELLTGGFYEPILSAIPDVDKVEQIAKLNVYLERHFGARPESLWLTERVWEPGLPRPLAEAGVRAVLVDDEHFHAVGVPHDDLAGYFRTEESGSPVSVFPILKELRYLVPFHPPEETVEFLRGWADESGERLAVLGDDGEKFGVWPGTHRLAFEEGWLRRFLALLEQNRDWLEVTTPSRWMGSHPSRGLVYLPTASYSEMMEWALPTPAQTAFEHLKNEAQRRLPEAGAFLRGGFWRNFLSKYAESNRMHKRTLDLSHRIRDLSEESRAEPLDALWQAQCNCAYWHGVFGGLYLPHLRDAIYRRLYRAERALSRLRGLSLSARELDLVSEEGGAWLVQNDHLLLGVAPERGGMVFEWGDLRTGHNLGNTLTRRTETYHQRLRQAAAEREAGGGRGGGSEDGGAVSIHDRVRSKETGLEKLLVQDAHVRASFLDHVLDPALGFESFQHHEGPGNEAGESGHGTREQGEWGEFLDRPYATDLDWEPGRVSLELRRVGRVRVPGPHETVVELEVSKRLTMLEGEPGFEMRYRLRHRAGPALDARFGVEWNVTYLTGSAPDRWVDLGLPHGRTGLGARRTFEDVRALALGDEWLDLVVESDIEPSSGVWMFPVETVSLSEDGFERNYQGTCLLFHWPLCLAPGGRMELRFEARHRPARAPATTTGSGDEAIAGSGNDAIAGSEQAQA